MQLIVSAGYTQPASPGVPTQTLTSDLTSFLFVFNFRKKVRVSLILFLLCKNMSSSSTKVTHFLKKTVDPHVQLITNTPEKNRAELYSYSNLIAANRNLSVM